MQLLFCGLMKNTDLCFRWCRHLDPTIEPRLINLGKEWMSDGNGTDLRAFPPNHNLYLNLNHSNLLIGL